MQNAGGMHLGSSWIRTLIVLGLLIAPVAPGPAGLAFPAAWAGDPEIAKRFGPTISAGAALSLGFDGRALHAWLGAGVRVPAQRYRAVLLGVEWDLPLADDATEADRHATGMTSSSGVEVWLVSRAVTGAYSASTWVPRYSAYAFAGVPLRIAEDGALLRVGVGASAIELLPLAEIGIPNMIEVGMDAGDRTIEGFLRLGWHL